MRKFFVFLTVLLFVTAFGIITEEQAREYFSKALMAWYEGDVKRAKELMETATSGLIYVTDIPDFWYFMAKIDIDMRAIQKAQEDLKTILVISPGKDEVLSLLKEIDILQREFTFTKPVVLEKLLSASGFSHGIEYFYSPTAAVLYGDTVIIADQANQRIVLFKYGAYTVIKTTVEPVSLEISPNGEIFAAGRKAVVKIDLTTRDEKVIHDGFSNALLAGFDRVGRLWGSDVNRLFFIEDDQVTFLNLPGFFVIQDVEISHNGIWILDLLSDKLILFDFSGKKLEERPALGGRCFEVAISGDPIVLTKNNELVLVGKNQLQTVSKLGDGVVLFDYRYPFLITFDWHRHVVDVYPMKGEEPIFVRVDSLSFLEETIRLNFRVENIFGDAIPFLVGLLQVREGGGAVYYEFKIACTQIEWLNPQKDFLSSALPYLRRGKAYGVLFEKSPADLSRADLITLKGKNVRIFLMEKANDLILLTGGAGEVRQRKPICLPYYTATFRRTRPIPSDITPVTVSVKIGNEIYSDTVYYTRGMIQ
ncbi:NHL repeat-containing protein [Pseudothermotoga thermarum]|uniref:Uncharacterized protein n=1 Tax=Pseudothermotoga thermarum DSM 5069 TaxID=688269 RepID=F7YVB6_9THEM|nr:hypothetical protein [Pseudothermotoga thermarum]AEH50419.1 hypothetical protein Theth_0324 [Pseudothermotoga thermarum DSM 5069]